MGCRNEGFFAEEEKAISDSFSDVLLFATMCIIGLPVDVHVKDGSIYSGIFYTACVDDDYEMEGLCSGLLQAIVLKNARMVKKGNRVANISDGRLIETLIILSEDLVQVVAKEVLVSAEGIDGKVGADDVGVTSGFVSKNVHQEREAKPSNSILHSREKNENYARLVDLSKDTFLDESAFDNTFEVENGKSDGPIFDKMDEPLSVSVNGCYPSITVDRHGDISPGKPSDIVDGPKTQRGQTSNEVKGSRTSFDVCETVSSGDFCTETKLEELPKLVSSRNSPVVRTKDQSHERQTSEDSQQTQCPAVLSSSVSCAASELGHRSPSTSTKMVPLKNANHGRTNMESKLNPRAKIFSPSTVHQRSATPPAVPTLASMTYMPDPSPAVPTATAEPEADITSFHCSSTPAKLLPHNNLVYGNGRSDLHYTHPIFGHLGSRTQPVRHAGQYNLLQPGAAYLPPNSQNVMAGRVGPFVYVHPVSNEIVTQSTAGFSQVPARPVLTPHPVNFPKQQGNAVIQAVQVYGAPPLIPNGHQPFAIPGYIPISQPLFPVMSPIPVPGSDGSLSTKFV